MEMDWGIKIYLKEIGKVDLLTPEQEVELAERIKRGDPEARSHMISANLRLVVKIAQDYANYGLPLLDLISEGNIGLMKAVERFDPSKGGKLSTYAAWWIKQSIKRGLCNQSKIIRLPVYMVDKISKMRRVAMAMSEELWRDPTDDELSQEIGIPREKIAQLIVAGMRPASLDAPISDEDPTEFGEHVADENAQTPLEQLSRKNMLKLLDAKLLNSVLDERECKIIDARFGLSGQKPRTLEEVGEDFGVTRERIRQLQNIALKKLFRALWKLDPDLKGGMSDQDKKPRNRQTSPPNVWKNTTVHDAVAKLHLPDPEKSTAVPFYIETGPQYEQALQVLVDDARAGKLKLEDIMVMQKMENFLRKRPLHIHFTGNVGRAHAPNWYALFLKMARYDFPDVYHRHAKSWCIQIAHLRGLLEKVFKAVRWTPLRELIPNYKTEVEYEAHEIPVRITSDKEYIHVRDILLRDVSNVRVTLQTILAESVNIWYTKMKEILQGMHLPNVHIRWMEKYPQNWASLLVKMANYRFKKDMPYILWPDVMMFLRELLSPPAVPVFPVVMDVKLENTWWRRLPPEKIDEFVRITFLWIKGGVNPEENVTSIAQMVEISPVEVVKRLYQTSTINLDRAVKILLRGDNGLGEKLGTSSVANLLGVEESVVTHLGL